MPYETVQQVLLPNFNSSVHVANFSEKLGVTVKQKLSLYRNKFQQKKREPRLRRGGSKPPYALDDPAQKETRLTNRLTLEEIIVWQRCKSLIPAQKVTVGVLAGSLTTILIWALKSVVVIPGEVAAAITTVLTFAASYLVPPSARDQVVDS